MSIANHSNKSWAKVIALLIVAVFVFSIGSSVHADGSEEWGIIDTYYPESDWGIVDTYYDDSDWGIVDTYWGDDYGIVDTYYDYDYGIVDTYYPDYYGIVDTYYDYGCGSYCGGGYSYDYGCGFSCYSYSLPGCSFCSGYSYSTPRYTPTYSVGQPARSSSSYFSNTNTNTNVNNITNIDNSINDSFNNYNSNNTSLVVATPQYPVVYTSPAPSCTINHALTGGYGYYTVGTVAYLSWTSQNATSAFLSNVGSVGVSGSQNVYPGYTTTYTLTVYGANGQTATCATTVNVNTYVPPIQPPTYIPPVVQQPYVALTQIPYTGFDFGPLGNMLYWLSLLGFAAAGAYLMVYYLPRLASTSAALQRDGSGKAGRGGAFTLATAMIPARRKFGPIVAPKAPILIEKETMEAAYVAPVIAALRKAGTSDTMAIIKSTDGSMPKIVIERN